MAYFNEASFSAMALPIPLEAPVTIAVFIDHFFIVKLRRRKIFFKNYPPVSVDKLADI
jgi:hypothetical protein